MRMSILLAAAIALAATGSAQARGHAHSHAHRSMRSTPVYDGGSNYYTNVSGHRVHRPVFSGQAPRGASAHCADGSWSFSEHRRGTCSHHGGVAGWR
jgi:hypothetical protein